MQQVKPERTGWRDERISRRHREWGIHCPAVDLDFVLIEYDHGKAVALVEYKHETVMDQYKMNPNYRALIDLADRAQVPLFLCFYADDFSWFKIVPLGKWAPGWLPRVSHMNEKDWVTFLYKIRGENVPSLILPKLNTNSPHGHTVQRRETNRAGGG